MLAHNMNTKSRSSVWLLRPAAIVILATSLDGARVLAADDTQPEMHSTADGRTGTETDR